jgi:16S rRNA (cytosine967-C5)-methyltransferase
MKSLEVVASVVQDPAAALVVQYSDPAPDARVADLCAAPGGKAVTLGARGNLVLAADVSRRRLGLVRENVRRVQQMAGQGRRLRVHTAQADALAPAVDQMDMVLVDVPCTGTGTLRRNPDVRWKLTAARLADLTALQGRILDACAEVVAKEGVLVYSTCSLEAEENEGQVDAFLRRRPDFRIEAGSGVDARYLDGLGQLSVLPQASGFDGAFAARLRRS